MGKARSQEPSRNSIKVQCLSLFLIRDAAAKTFTTSVAYNTITMAAAADTVPPRPTLQPSGSIRISLHRRHASLSSYQATCISKHYALNNQILAAFESNYQNQLWPVAYQFGLRFVETALLETPKHGYFYSEKFARLRLQSTVDALRVCHSLQELVAKEPNELGKECHKIELLYNLATDQYEHLPVYEESRKRTERELARAYPKESDMYTDDDGHRRGAGSSSSFTSTLLACGDTFSAVFCPGSQRNISNDEYKAGFPDETSAIADEARRTNQYPPTSTEGRQPEESIKTISSSSTKHTRQSADPDGLQSTGSLLDKEEEWGEKGVDTKRKMSKFSPEIAIGIAMDLPDPALPPYPCVRAQSDYDLQRALFISGLQVELPGLGESALSSVEMGSISEQEPFAPPGAKKREETSPGLTTDLLSSCYHEDFDTLRNKGRVSIWRLPTYQGRIPGSTNGCTIIAPLLCIHHFVNENTDPDAGLPDQTVVQVIDDEAPTILPIVRQNLGLVKNAFLIPVDAHESLMQQNYMCQEQFLNVCGGNILDEEHLQPFLEQMSKVEPKRLAASFFFHEHVITILQLRRGSESVWFDVIDSLPREETLLRIGESSLNGSSLGCRSSDAVTNSSAYGSKGSDKEEAMDGAFSDELLVDYSPSPRAARIRCMDAESLKTTLLWYACSVFTAENRAYIDTYEWDEKLSDFDPRVFQAFIWTEV